MSSEIVPSIILKRKSKKTSDSASTSAKHAKRSTQTVTPDPSDTGIEGADNFEFSSVEAAEAFFTDTATVRDFKKELDFLKAQQTDILEQKFLERSVHRIADVAVGTIITVRGHRIETAGQYGDYPIIKGDFGEEVDAEVALPARYLKKFDGRALPFYMLYAGTCEYQGKTLQKVEFINMKTLNRAIGGK